MKSIELRKGCRFVSYAVLAMASAACEPTILLGTPPGQGGQAGQGGGVDDGGVAGAGGAGGEAGAGEFWTPC